MQELLRRTEEDGIAHHQGIPVRVYDSDGVHAGRIEKSRTALSRCLGQNSRAHIVELGCGTADISGPFAEQHRVTGIECNFAAASEGLRRFPAMVYRVAPISEVVPMKSDVLVLCEVLEHLADPVAVVKRWGRLAEQMVISHPLNEPAGCGLSGGEHQWSFNEEDFENWFRLSGHELAEREVFQMGGYQIVLGRGKVQSSKT